MKALYWMYPSQPAMFNQHGVGTGWAVNAQYVTDQDSNIYSVLTATLSGFSDFTSVETAIRSAVKSDINSRYSTTISDGDLNRLLL